MNRVAEPSLLPVPLGVKILISPIISERFRSNPPMLRRAHRDRRGGIGSPLVETGFKPAPNAVQARMVPQAHHERLGNRFAVVFRGCGLVNRVGESSLLPAPTGVKILIFPIISERFRSNQRMLRRAHRERRGETGSPLVEAGLKPVATLSMPRMVRQAHHERLGNRFAVVLSGVLVREPGGRAILLVRAAGGENSGFSDHFRAFPLKSANASTGSP